MAGGRVGRCGSSWVRGGGKAGLPLGGHSTDITAGGEVALALLCHCKTRRCRPARPAPRCRPAALPALPRAPRLPSRCPSCCLLPGLGALTAARRGARGEGVMELPWLQVAGRAPLCGMHCAITSAPKDRQTGPTEAGRGGEYTRWRVRPGEQGFWALMSHDLSTSSSDGAAATCSPEPSLGQQGPGWRAGSLLPSLLLPIQLGWCRHLLSVTACGRGPAAMEGLDLPDWTQGLLIERSGIDCSPPKKPLAQVGWRQRQGGGVGGRAGTASRSWRQTKRGLPACGHNFECPGPPSSAGDAQGWQHTARERAGAPWRSR